MNKTLQSGMVQKWWISLKTSLWFLPAIIVLFAIGLAFGLMELDELYGKQLSEAYPRLFAQEAESARTMLGTIASSMATIVGVVFSIVIVALVLAATQYTSRILRTFMGDRITQVMTGTLTGIYTYSLLVLGRIDGNSDALVPALSVLGGVILALIGIALFIMLIHHMASSIQASTIISEVTKETIDALKDTYPLETDEQSEGAGFKESPGFDWHPVLANKMGYVQSAKSQALIQFASENDTVVQMKCCVGRYVDNNTELVRLYVAEPLDEKTISEVRDLFAIDSFRTVEQDPSYGIRQLVDIALKALSPGINDTTTAVTCLEHLATILTACANRVIPAPDRYHNGQLRLMNDGPGFDNLVRLAFAQILEVARGNSEIYIRLLDALSKVLHANQDKQRIPIIKRMFDEVNEEVELQVKNQQTKDRVREHLSRLAKSIHAAESNS